MCTMNFRLEKLHIYSDHKFHTFLTQVLGQMLVHWTEWSIGWGTAKSASFLSIFFVNTGSYGYKTNSGGSTSRLLPLMHFFVYFVWGRNPMIVILAIFVSINITYLRPKRGRSPVFLITTIIELSGSSCLTWLKSIRPKSKIYFCKPKLASYPRGGRIETCKF